MDCKIFSNTFREQERKREKQRERERKREKEREFCAFCLQYHWKTLIYQVMINAFDKSAPKKDEKYARDNSMLFICNSLRNVSMKRSRLWDFYKRMIISKRMIKSQ